MDDCVRRFDAIDSITDDSLIRNMDSIDDGWIRKCKRAAQRVLASIQPADVRENVQTVNVSNSFPSDAFKCYECGIHIQDWDRVREDEDGNCFLEEFEFKYCPNCGAIIRSKTDETKQLDA